MFKKSIKRKLKTFNNFIKKSKDTKFKAKTRNVAILIKPLTKIDKKYGSKWLIYK